MISVAKGENFSISFAYGGRLVRTRRTDTETICRKSINLLSIHFKSIASQHIERIRPPRFWPGIGDFLEKYSILAQNRRFQVDPFQYVSTTSRLALFSFAPNLTMFLLEV